MYISFIEYIYTYVCIYIYYCSYKYVKQVPWKLPNFADEVVVISTHSAVFPIWICNEGSLNRMTWPGWAGQLVDCFMVDV